jgi:all-trans-retinol 13,14-reductase
MVYDLIIIGSGISGLTSALLAAKEGMKCLLIERMPYSGGSLRGFYYRGDYYPFGLSLVGSLEKDSFLYMLLSYLGIMDKVRFKTFPNEEIFTLVKENSRISLPSNFLLFFDELLQLFPDEKASIDAVRAKLEHFKKNNFIYHLDSSGAGDFFELFLDTGESIWEVFREIKNQKLKKMLASFTFLYGVLPADTPFFVYAPILISYLSKCCYLEGGGISLVKTMEEELVKKNVDIKTNEEVQKLVIENGTVRAVRTDKAEYRGKEILFTGEPKSLIPMIPEENLKKRFKRKLESYYTGISAFGAYFEAQSLVKVPKDLYYRNFIAFSAQDMPLTLQDFEKMSLSERLNHVSIFTNMDNGKLQIYALIPDSYGEYKDLNRAGYEEKKENTRIMLQRKVEEMIPELKGNLKYKLSFTPCTIKDYMGYEDGSILGLYASKEQKGIYSIMPYTPYKNLYLAGQNIFLPGVVGSMASALIVFSKISKGKIFEKIKMNIKFND